MRFSVEAGGRRRTIEVHRSGDQWTVTVDGRPRSASLARVESRWSLLLGEGGIASADSAAALGKPVSSYEIAIESSGRGEYSVHVDSRVVPVAILDPRTRAARGRHSGSTSGPSGVVSPMPGRVVKVLVAAGDVVAARQALVVVEAMKMENEFRAPRAGMVTEVRVREGELVEANNVLVVIGHL